MTETDTKDGTVAANSNGTKIEAAAAVQHEAARRMMAATQDEVRITSTRPKSKWEKGQAYEHADTGLSPGAQRERTRAQNTKTRLQIRRDLRFPWWIRGVQFLLLMIDQPLVFAYLWLPKGWSFFQVWALGRVDADVLNERDECCDTCPHAVIVHGQAKCSVRMGKCKCIDWWGTDTHNANKFAALSCPLPGDRQRFKADPRTKRQEPEPKRRDFDRTPSPSALDRLEIHVAELRKISGLKTGSTAPKS